MTDDRFEADVAVSLSDKVSLKRIADALEARHLLRYGELPAETLKRKKMSEAGVVG